MLNSTSVRASTRPIAWAFRMLRDPSLIDGATAVSPGGRTADDDRVRAITWLLCGRSG